MLFRSVSQSRYGETTKIRNASFVVSPNRNIHSGLVHVFYSRCSGWTVQQDPLAIHLSTLVQEESLQFSEEVFECFVRGPIEVLMRVLKKPHNRQLIEIWIEGPLKSIDLCHPKDDRHVLI